MLKTLKEFCTKRIDDLENPNERQWFLRIKSRVREELAKLKLETFQHPVEYRGLEKKGKKTAQGTMELFVDVFDSLQAKLIPYQKISKPIP